MASNLEGKTALLTAAGQGIGRATALMMAQSGAQVIATDINQANLDNLAKENSNIQTMILDVMDQSNIDAVKAKITKLDILFNCAGFVHGGTILGCPEDEWEFAFNLNVKSMYRMIKSFLPTMLEGQNGSIVNMSSVASSIKGAPNRFVYGTTKAAVIGLTKSVAVDYVTQGIRCNAICPGTIQSPSLEDRIRAGGDYEKTRTNFIQRQPIGRLGTAEEVAVLACYLASDGSGFTTGQTHIIDGGWSN